MVEIFDLNKNKYIPDGNFWSLCDLQEFDTFNGISFVSNLKFVEKYLLLRFKRVNLILGLSDNGSNPIGQFLQGILDKRADYAKEIDLSDTLKSRILDGTLTFKFTKKADNLIHSKFYLLENDTSYSAFIGSMNLTNAAVNKNHEMLTYFTGNKQDTRYNLFNSAWQHNWNLSSEYLDAKHLSGIYAQNKPDQIAVSVYHDSADMLTNKDNSDTKNVYIVDKDELKQFKDNQTKHFDDLDLPSKITVMQTTRIFGDSGSLRQKKTLENIAPELFDVKQKLVYIKDETKNAKKVESDLELYPKPMLSYNQDLNSIYTAPKLGDDLHLTKLTAEKPSLDDVKIFNDIVNEYQTSKLQGEGQQACNFLLYLFESPFLWKIRNMYHANSGSVKRREDVPIGTILIGNGRTGKSTLGVTLGSLLVGDTNPVKSGNEYFGQNQKNANLSKFVSRYLRTSNLISPLFVDDAATEYFTKNYFASSIKDISNDEDNTNPLPAVIYTTNLTDTKSDARVTTKPEILRRMYYLGFESPFKADQDKYINALLVRANNHLFKYTQLKLNEFFNNISEETEAKIEDDYLYPIKTVLTEIFKEYGVYDFIKPYFESNYDFITSSGKRDWKTLVESATYQNLINFVDNGKIANFPKELFKQLSNNLNHDNGSTVMKRYFNLLPREYEISANVTEAGFDVNVENFDKYMKSPILKQLYEDRSGITALKHQDEQRQKDLEAQAALIASALEKHDEINNRHKKHGLFGWLHKK